MYRVAGAMKFSISPAKWAAALVVVAGWIAGALFIAQHITSLKQPALPESALTAPEPSQTPNRAAKTAREPFKQARLAPDPSMLGASRQTPQDEGDGARTETGRASWYDLEANTASGEAMDGEALTAAHPSLPFGSKVRVANLDNGRSVVVRINDRGPFSKGRIIDVSRAAAEKLGMLGAGVARVSVNPVDDEIPSDKVASASAE